MDAGPSRGLFSFAELSHSWGISALSLRRAASDGRIKTIRIGARVLVPADEKTRIEREGTDGNPRRASREGKKAARSH
jgi:hypothetical protein